MAGKIRIAFVANTSWSIYKFRLYIIKELLDKGFAVFVLAPRDYYTEQFENLPGLQFVPLKHFANKKASPWNGLLLYAELKKAYRTIAPHLIFHYTIKANIFGTIAAGRRYRCVSVITGLGYAFMENSTLQSIARFLYKFSLRYANEVWFLNHDDLKVFTKRYRLVQASKTFVLPGEGINTDVFYPAPYQPSEKPVTYLLIGRLIKYKGIYEFVEAVRALKQKGLPISCQVLGKFDPAIPGAISKAELDQWETGKLVNYLGESDNVVPYIAEADCVVLPSYSEGIPLSLMEGASMCKAIIATDTAGCRELVTENVNGYLCSTKNAASLADKMERYYHLSPRQKKEMGLKGRELMIARYEKKIVAGIYHNKIQQLAN